MRLAEELERAAGWLSFNEMVDLLYRLRPPARPQLQARHRAHFELEAERARAALARLAAAGDGPLLDVGCGMGRYLAAGARAGREVFGVDAALYQLVLARKLLREEGLEAQFCLADARDLPFEQGLFASAVATDLLEHVADPGAVIAEIGRVLRPGGLAYFTTPNRYSLTSEPHVGIWGLGYMPRPWADRLVERRLGIDYRPIRPLSYAGLLLLERSFPGRWEIELPLPGAAELATFAPAKRAAARAYSLLAGTPGLRGAVARVAPYFVAVGEAR